MNPWAIAAFVGIGGLIFLASQAAGAAEDECEFGLEYAFPHMGLSAVMIRECITDEGTVWLWDAAMLADVEIGEAFKPTDWPHEVSLAFGQEKTEAEAMAAATAWVEANTEFVMGGGQRSPLAERVESFLAALSPTEFDSLREIFRFEGTAVSDAWPYVEELRVAVTDDDFLDVADQLGNKLSFLSDEEQSAMRDEVLSTLGVGNALTLRGILSDAGVA